MTVRSPDMSEQTGRTVRLPPIRATRFDIAVVMFAVPATALAVSLVAYHGRELALLALPFVAAALLARRSPAVGTVAIILGSTILRIGYYGIGYSTQVDHARNAAALVLEGNSPYGVLIPSASAPPEPFAYGPLAMLWWLPGPVIEFLASIAVMVLLVRMRSWITLAVYAGIPFGVYLTWTGVNDYSPGLLIATGMLLLRSRPVAGAGVLAMAAAIKPYAVAWFLPAIGFAGWAAAAALAVVTAVLWSPLIVWGVPGFVRSMELHREVHPVQENALNLPLLRWLAAPLALVGLLTRRWHAAVLVGAGVFIVYLFLDRWASLGYWLAVIPAGGIALESWWMERGSAA